MCGILAQLLMPAGVAHAVGSRFELVTPGPIGANQRVVIDGQLQETFDCPGGVPDIVELGFVRARVYVVRTGSAVPGAPLTDVSGTPNLVIGPGRTGIFADQTIAVTKPTGSVGEGDYDVVYDECEDGRYDPIGPDGSGDLLVPHAFKVSFIDPNIPTLPSLTRFKTDASTMQVQSQRFYASFRSLVIVVSSALLLAEAVNPSAIEILLGLPTTLANLAHLIDLERALDKAGEAVVDGYKGLAADPPDPAFEQLTELPRRDAVAADGTNAIALAVADHRSVASGEGAAAQALLHAMERFQGAKAAGRPTWALVHAREVRDIARLLADRVRASGQSLQAFETALAGPSAPSDGALTSFEAIRQRIMTSGFSADEVAEARKLGLTDADLETMRGGLADVGAPASRAGTADAAGRLRSTGQAMAADLDGLATDMGPVISVLEANPLSELDVPGASAGGPYSGPEGAPITFDATATRSASAITTFAWDLDGDGAFDDATGPRPTYSFTRPTNGLVGVKVTNAAGLAGVAFAPVAVSEANRPPRIDSATPAGSLVTIPSGGTQAFTVAVSDPENDPVSVTWSVDGGRAGTGPSFTYAPGEPDQGIHEIVATARDASPYGGSADQRWVVGAQGDSRPPGRPLGALTQLPAPSGCVASTDRGGLCAAGRGLYFGNQFLGQTVAVSPDGRNLYASAPINGAVRGAVLVFERDRASGALRQLPGPDGCIAYAGIEGEDCAAGRGLAGAQAVAVSPDGRNVYVSTLGGVVVVLARNPDNGTLTQLAGAGGCLSGNDNPVTAAGCERVPTLGQSAASLVVSPDGKQVYVSATVLNTLDTAVTVLARGADGALRPVDGAAGCVSEILDTCGHARDFRHVETITMSPDGHSLYAISEGTFPDVGAIVAFSRDAGSGALTQLPDAAGCLSPTAVSCTRTRLVGQPTVIDVSPDGSQVYAALDSGAVEILARAGATGTLSQPAGPDGCVIKGGSSDCADADADLGYIYSMALSPDGRNLYTMAADSAARLTVFGRNPATGGLRLLKGADGCVRQAAPCGIANPFPTGKGVAVSPDGASVYVRSNQADGQITAFARLGTPVCTGATVQVAFQSPTSVALACVDPNGDRLRRSVVTPPAHGTLSVIDQVTGTLTYTPDAGFGGTDSFGFTANDGTADSGTATITLTVAANPSPLNRGPVAVGDAVTTPEDQPVSIPIATLLGNDTDPDGDPLTITAVDALPATHGNVRIVGDAVVYEPQPNYNGSAQFVYHVADGHGGTDTALVTVTVVPVNDPPVADAQAKSTTQDAAIPIVLGGSDPEGAAITFAVVGRPAHGTLSGTAPALTYTPSPGQHGGDSFTFVVNDGQTASAPATVTVTTNGRPTLTASAGSVQYSDPIASLRVSATDPEGDPVTLAAQGLPAGLTFTDAHDGTGAVGGTALAEPRTYTVTYRADDGVNPVAGTAQSSITVTREDCTVTAPDTVFSSAGAATRLTATLGETDQTLGDRGGKTVRFAGTDTLMNPVGPYTATTDATGTATLDVPLGPGVYAIGAAFAGDPFYAPCGPTQDTLVTVAPAQFKATGGGWTANGSGRTSFGFTVTRDVTGLHGQLQLRTAGKGTFHGTTVSSLTGSGNAAQWAGTGAWNGTRGYRFTASVVDQGTSGRNGDTIAVTVTDPRGTTVFSTNGHQPLKGGNLVVH